VTAQLPGLEIEIVHRVSPNRDAEQISINLQALPSLAFGGWLEATHPFSFWMHAAQLFWAPWLDMMNPDRLQGGAARQLPRHDAAAPPLHGPEEPA
jgi:hypothetical protein